MVIRKVAISAKIGKLWKITAFYIKLTKMRNVDNYDEYNRLVNIISWIYQREEQDIQNTNKHVDFIKFEQEIKEVLQRK